MADSEKSYTDRLSKAQMLLDFTLAFSPAFEPADASLGTGPFGAYLGTVLAANDSVTAMLGTYGEKTAARAAKAAEMRPLLTRALNYVRSNQAWSTHYHVAKQFVDRVRGTRPPKTPPPADPPDPAEPPKPPRNRGQQAYEELASHLNGFVGVVDNIAGYAPPGTGIGPADLAAFLTAFRLLNTEVTSLYVDLSAARAARRLLYVAPNGLADKFQAIKAAIKGQYGTASAEWEQVKGLKW